jgi:arabinan endo-1,5-alpha-L-arabinosidase
MRKGFFIGPVLVAMHAPAQVMPVTEVTALPAEQTTVHDPVMILQGKTYYLFSTGNGISVKSSVDLKNWAKEKPVFDTPPKWAVDAVPGFKGHIWAPDISYQGGKYYLYYSISTFGKNNSCIGVAFNKTLDPRSPDYKWEDQGKVIQSIPGRDQWNAIDPNLVVDEAGTPWLSFGSFWTGIKLVKLNADLVSVYQPEEWHTIAARPAKAELPNTVIGNSAIEAPFIFRKNNKYYLFVSWDYCCRGEKSNYKIVVGRCEKVTGPYLDKNGISMQQNGGSLLAEGDQKNWYAVGHNAVYNFQQQDYIIYHGYDANDKGRSRLIIRKLDWDHEGWPKLN